MLAKSFTLGLMMASGFFAIASPVDDVVRDVECTDADAEAMPPTFGVIAGVVSPRSGLAPA